MKHSKILAWVVIAIATAQPLAGQSSSRFFNPKTERRIDSLLALMTLDEKLGQLNQLPGRWDEKAGRVVLTNEQRALVEQGSVGSFLGGLGLEASREMQEAAVRKSRLGIPLIFGHDVIHGYRTVFPIPLAEACTFDPEAVEMAARISAREATAAGVHWTFAPMVDVARDPRWGRIAEGSGEDTHLGSILAAARVRGFQGSDFSDPTTLVACAKHFAAYGAAEAGRDYNRADIPERTLREIYLPPFKAAVDAGVGTLMSAFNEIDGIPATAHKGIMTDILRNEWNFKGFVVSDFTAVMELLHHGIAASPAEAAVQALTAGVDMEMVSEFYRKELPEMVRKGLISSKTVDEAVRRVLRVKFALGLFDNPFRNDDQARFEKDILRKDHRSFAREYAAKAIVLLKNENNLLPLSEPKTIAVIGPLANSRHEPLGPWRGEGKAEDVVTLLEGIRSAVSSKTRVLYARGCDSTFSGTNEFPEAMRTAREADVVVLAVGERHEMSGEAASRTDIGLPGVQHELVRQIQETGKPVVLVLMNGRPLAIPWEAEHVPAILESWFLGVESGNAIADVLFGRVNPSGKLSVSIPRSAGQVPLYYNHKNTGRPPSDHKFTSKYLDSPNTPLYHFGHGLSYTTFMYSDLKVSKKNLKIGESLEVSAGIRNSGNREGAEVVQLYIRDLVASVTRPVKELRGFKRIRLKPGERSIVRFLLTPQDLEFYGLDMKRIVEPGLFKVFVGGNSVDLLEGEFEVVP